MSNNMTLTDLIHIASEAYPDGYLLEYWDDRKNCVKENPDAGDTLALFIVKELKDTYDADADDAQKLLVASRVMAMATRELEDVANHLMEAYERKAEQ